MGLVYVNVVKTMLKKVRAKGNRTCKRCGNKIFKAQLCVEIGAYMNRQSWDIDCALKEINKEI